MNPVSPTTSMAEDESESAWPFFDFDFEPRGSFGFAGLSNSSTVSTDSTAVSTNSRSTLERLLEEAYKPPQTPQPFSPTSSTGHFSDGGWGGRSFEPSWATSAGSYPPTRSPQSGAFPWQQFGASEAATTRASEAPAVALPIPPLTHGFSQQPIIINHYHYHQPPPVKAAPAPRRRSPKAPGRQDPTVPLTPILCRPTPGEQFPPPGERADPFVLPATLSLGAASCGPALTHPSVNISRPEYRVPVYQEPQKRPGFVQPGRQNKRARAQGVSGPSTPPEQLNLLEDHLPFGKRPEHAEALRELDNFRLEELTNPDPTIGSHPRRVRPAVRNGSSRMSNFLQGALDRFVTSSPPNGEDLEEPVGVTGQPGDQIPPRT